MTIELRGPGKVNRDQTNPEWTDEDDAITDAIWDGTATKEQPRDEHGRFAAVAEHVAEHHRGMGGWGKHGRGPGLPHERDPMRQHRHTKYGAVISTSGGIFKDIDLGAPERRDLFGIELRGPERKDWNEDAHPRDERGRFAGDGSEVTGNPVQHDGGGPAPGEPVLNSIPRGPFHQVQTAEEALQALAQGRYVQLPPEQVGTLLDKMAEVAQEAKDKGEKAPVYDLCNVSVPNTNIFCEGNLGIERAKMPQIDDRGAFLSYLRGEGVKFSEGNTPANQLKATQSQLDGATVGTMMREAEAGQFNPRQTPIFVSSDNFVLDGHHRWAATVGLDYQDDKQAEGLTIQTVRVDLPISVLLGVANKFDEETGVQKRAVGQDMMSPEEFLKKNQREFDEAQHPRDEHGRFEGDGGGEPIPANARVTLDNGAVHLPHRMVGQPDVRTGYISGDKTLPNVRLVSHRSASVRTDEGIDRSGGQQGAYERVVAKEKLAQAITNSSRYSYPDDKLTAEYTSDPPTKTMQNVIFLHPEQYARP